MTLWRLYPLVLALQALRGFQLIQAATIAAEIAGIERFEAARQLMGYLELVPSEYSSADSRTQGRITKTGNGHARKALIEAAWHYRLPARITPIIARRQSGLPKPVRDIAWKAQLRLCARWRCLAVTKSQPTKSSWPPHASSAASCGPSLVRCKAPATERWPERV